MERLWKEELQLVCHIQGDQSGHFAASLALAEASCESRENFVAEKSYAVSVSFKLKTLISYLLCIY